MLTADNGLVITENSTGRQILNSWLLQRGKQPGPDVRVCSDSSCILLPGSGCCEPCVGSNHDTNLYSTALRAVQAGRDPQRSSSSPCAMGRGDAGGFMGFPIRRGCSNPPWPGSSVFGVTSHVQVALGVPWPHSSLGCAPCALNFLCLEGTEADGTAVIREMPA